MRPTRTLLIVFSLAILAFATSCNKQNSSGGASMNIGSFANENLTLKVQVPCSNNLSEYIVEATVYEASQPAQIIQITQHDATQYESGQVKGLRQSISTTVNTMKIILHFYNPTIPGSHRYWTLGSRSATIPVIRYVDLQ